MNPCTVLYAEDEANDVIFLEIAFKRVGSPHKLAVVPDGAQAIEYLAGKGTFADRTRHPLPVLVLLDINMPKKNGFEVLQWIRQQRQFKSLPIILLTSSTREEDTEKARQLGANDYLLKFPDVFKLVELVKSLHDRWLSQATGAPAIDSRKSNGTVAEIGSRAKRI